MGPIQDPAPVHPANWNDSSGCAIMTMQSRGVE
jgi:hypothetical protein